MSFSLLSLLRLQLIVEVLDERVPETLLTTMNLSVKGVLSLLKVRMFSSVQKGCR